MIMPFEKSVDIIKKEEVAGFLDALMAAIRPVIDLAMESLEMIRKGM